MSFKENLKEYFTFTKSEGKGIVVLLIILIFAVAANLLLPLIYTHPTCTSAEFNNIIDTLNTEIAAADSSVDLSDNEKLINQYDTLSLFKFNPNNFSEEQAIQLGISDYQYRMIQKYISAGGSFKYKQDFAKIYSIKDTQFKKLYPYIDLPEKNNFERNETRSVQEKQTVEYFDFNPNTLDDKGWIKLGFSEKQAESIKKYIRKGGRFYKKEDLKKLYVIDETKYADLEPYIRIEEIKNKSEKTEEHKKIDINNLSADEMKKYGRFWQYNAERIVKYRNLLGGFYKKEQLSEVYGVKKQYYDKIANDIIIDKSKLKKININFAEVSELGRHPYISYDEAKQIINFRNKNGAYKKLSDLVDKKIISDYLYNKISPYLKIK